MTLNILKRFSSSSKANILANFAGNSWSALIGLLLSPVYIHILGIEAYGLIGFSILIYALATTCDFGLARTLTKESATHDIDQEARTRKLPDLIKTIEVIYWAIGFVISFSLVLGSEYIVLSWLRMESIGFKDAFYSIVLIGLSLFFQWPVAIYTAIFQGLEKHVQLNTILIITNSLKHIFGLLFVLCWSSVEYLFLGYLFASVITILWLRRKTWRLVRAKGYSSCGRFRFKTIQSLWKFSAGVFGTQVLSVAITQTDKILVSSLLSLELFGCYSIAHMVASSLSLISKPFSVTFFPKLSKLVELKDNPSLRSHYLHACELAASVLFPCSFVLILFSQEILNYWLQNQGVAENTSMPLSLLVIAATINGLISLPYGLQLAQGVTKISFYQNLVSLLVQVPLTFYFIDKFGLIGAAIPRVIHNFSYLLIMIPLMHKTILEQDMWRWYFVGLLRPACITGVVIALVLFVFSFTAIPALALILIGLLTSLIIGIKLRSQ